MYDLSTMGPGDRGEYVERTRAGSNVVVLEPDVARAFPTGESVNQARRLLVRVAEAAKVSA